MLTPSRVAPGPTPTNSGDATGKGYVDTAISAVELAAWTGKALRYAQDVGNASLTQIDVTHGLGTTDVHVQCMVKSTGAQAEVEATALNTRRSASTS